MTTRLVVLLREQQYQDYTLTLTSYLSLRNGKLYRTLPILVEDENTKPGYCKLQVLSKGVPQTSDHVNKTDEFGTTYKLDQKNRIVACKRQLSGILAESHGPADTSLPKVIRPATDMVQGYRCQSWPAIAEQWLSRRRPYNWPPQAMIDEVKALGFFVVPVGHPNSSERNKEWRISLSLQERLLMFHLNPTQHKCFILLKLIKNEILLHLVGEASISSYHCKTCILYTIENTPSKLWAAENLLSCLQCCLLCLLGWTINWYCPNYFIPEENMFEGRMDSRIQKTLIEALQKLLLADFTYLALITCDSFGKRLEEIFLKPDASSIVHYQLQAEQIIRMYCNEKFVALNIRNDILSKCSDKNIGLCVQYLLKALSELNNTDVITEHTKDETMKAISLVIPMVEVSLMSNIVQLYAGKGDTELIFTLLTSQRWRQLRFISDPYTAGLKQATLLLMIGHAKASLEVLNSLQSLLSEEMTISVCDCRLCTGPLNTEKLSFYALYHNLTEETVHHNFIAPCIVFQQTERDLTPVALRYEMMRSIGTPPELRDMSRYWYNWAVIDSKCLLHFLLYLNHSKLDMPSNALDDIKTLTFILEKEPNISHRETGYNLLGWILKQQGLFREAFDCFRKSLELCPTNNAAIWHIIESLLQ